MREICACGHKKSQHSIQENNHFCLAIKTFAQGFDYYCECKSYSPKYPTTQDVQKDHSLAYQSHKPLDVGLNKQFLKQLTKSLYDAKEGKIRKVICNHTNLKINFDSLMLENSFLKRRIRILEKKNHPIRQQKAEKDLIEQLIFDSENIIILQNDYKKGYRNLRNGLLELTGLIQIKTIYQGLEDTKEGRIRKVKK